MHDLNLIFLIQRVLNYLTFNETTFRLFILMSYIREIYNKIYYNNAGSVLELCFFDASPDHS